jgi:hypothetical protein
MKFWREHGLYWDDPLRWYERGGLVTWWLGQFVFFASFPAAFAVLYVGDFEDTAVNGSLGCVLIGCVVLLGSRFLLAFSLRKRRRRGVRVY